MQRQLILPIIIRLRILTTSTPFDYSYYHLSKLILSILDKLSRHLMIHIALMLFSTIFFQSQRNYLKCSLRVISIFLSFPLLFQPTEWFLLSQSVYNVFSNPRPSPQSPQFKIVIWVPSWIGMTTKPISTGARPNQT